MNNRQQELQLFRVGLMMAGTLILAAAIIVSIGSNQGVFSRKAIYKVYFKNIGGLLEGAPVKLSGVPIGFVTDISFPDDPARTDIEIHFEVERRKARRIRVGTEAKLQSLSLLSGEKYVELTPGDPGRDALPAGSIIPAVERGGGIEEIGAATTDVAAEVVKIADNLNRILVSINSGEGLLGKIVADPTFGEATLHKLEQSMESLRAVLQRVESGRGAAGKLLADEAYGDKVATQLDQATSSLSSILHKIDSGDGTAGQLVNDTESGRAIVANLRQATDALREILVEIKSGQGLAARLVYDKEYGDKVSGDLQAAVENIRRITEKIDRGDGSIAKVINDPGLYASLHDIVSGIEKSRIVGGVLRHYQKKGLKNRAQTAADKDPEGALETLEETYGEELDEPAKK